MDIVRVGRNPIICYYCFLRLYSLYLNCCGVFFGNCVSCCPYCYALVSRCLSFLLQNRPTSSICTTFSRSCWQISRFKMQEFLRLKITLFKLNPASNYINLQWSILFGRFSFALNFIEKMLEPHYYLCILHGLFWSPSVFKKWWVRIFFSSFTIIIIMQLSYLNNSYLHVRVSLI